MLEPKLSDPHVIFLALVIVVSIFFGGGAEVGEIVIPGWIGTVLTSAVIASLVSSGVNYWLKKKEFSKADQKERIISDHVYLDLIIALEIFSEECWTHWSDIEDALGEARQSHSFDPFSKLKAPLLEFPEHISWPAIDIQDAARLKRLPVKYKHAQEHIHSAFMYWADQFDAYELEQQRVIHYALQAWDIALLFRERIGARDDSREFDKAQVEELRENFRPDEEKTGVLLPDLVAYFSANPPREVAKLDC